MIPKSLPSGLTRGWEPIFGTDHAQWLNLRGLMAVELPASEEESAARATIAQAGTALSQRRGDIPASFVAQLYGRAVPEDVVRYGAADLGRLAERAFDFLAERQPGVPKIRCETVTLTASGERKAVAVIEIVNDDMPFLVDSG